MLIGSNSSFFTYFTYFFHVTYKMTDSWLIFNLLFAYFFHCKKVS